MTCYNISSLAQTGSWQSASLICATNMGMAQLVNPRVSNMYACNIF